MTNLNRTVKVSCSTPRGYETFSERSGHDVFVRALYGDPERVLRDFVLSDIYSSFLDLELRPSDLAFGAPRKFLRTIPLVI